MKLIFNYGKVYFEYTRNINWWGTALNCSMHLDGEVVSFNEYVKNIKRLV